MPDATSDDLSRIALAYLAALERDAPFEELTEFFTADCIQEEFPNRLMPNGARRTLQDIRVAAERGAKAVEHQRYEVMNSVASGNHVALEVRWSCRIVTPLGSLGVGDSMRARFAVFLTFHEGRIQRQHNYDCFDPF